MFNYCFWYLDVVSFLKFWKNGRFMRSWRRLLMILTRFVFFWRWWLIKLWCFVIGNVSFRLLDIYLMWKLIIFCLEIWLRFFCYSIKRILRMCVFRLWKRRILKLSWSKWLMIGVFRIFSLLVLRLGVSFCWKVILFSR